MKRKSKNLKVSAKIFSDQQPVTVFVPWKDWLFAVTRGTNVRGYRNGEWHWINRWNAVRVKQ